MLGVERVKELINDPNLSDKEVEEIRDGLFMLAEVMFEQWQAERIKAKKEKEDKDNQNDMKNQPDNNSFTTSDFYAAAFLVAKGYTLLGIDKADSRRFHFIFTNAPDRPQLVSAFFAGLVEVNAKAFVTAIKELKSLMYNDAMS